MSASKGGKGADASSQISEGGDCCDADKMLRISEVVIRYKNSRVFATPSGWWPYEGGVDFEIEEIVAGCCK